MNHTINQIAITTASSILEIQDLTMDFGGIKALDKLNLNIPDAMISALIGPNGAGKTTLFNCLTGIYQPTDGSLLLAKKNGSKKILSTSNPTKLPDRDLPELFKTFDFSKK